MGFSLQRAGAAWPRGGDGGGARRPQAPSLGFARRSAQRPPPAGVRADQHGGLRGPDRDHAGVPVEPAPPARQLRSGLGLGARAARLEHRPGLRLPPGPNGCFEPAIVPRTPTGLPSGSPDRAGRIVYTANRTPCMNRISMSMSAATLRGARRRLGHTWRRRALARFEGRAGNRPDLHPSR